MSKVTILDMYKLSKAQSTPLLAVPSVLAGYDFMAEYASGYEEYDRYFAKTRRSFAPIWNLDMEDDSTDVLAEFREDVESMLAKNAEKYTRL